MGDFEVAIGASRVAEAGQSGHRIVQLTDKLKDEPMSAYVIFDVEIRDMSRYQDFMKGVKPALDAAGARYLARGGAHQVHEGDWQPRRIVILEFPSIAAWETFYTGPVYQGLKSVRDECSSARLVSVEGLA